MPYTLAKFFVWGLLLAFVGGAIGWMLRSLLCRRDVAAARASTVDDVELERLRHRLANLEPAVAERDRLKTQLDEARHELAVARAAPIAAAADPVAAAADPVAAAGFTSLGDAGPAPGTAEADAPEAGSSEAGAPQAGSSEAGTPRLDMDVAAAALGGTVKLDDLTVVEGIGPEIAELCHGAGIHTWRDLAGASPGVLRTMLEDAGPSFKMHDPTTWPQQALLLSEGRWDEFKALTDELTGGR